MTMPQDTERAAFLAWYERQCEKNPLLRTPESRWMGFRAWKANAATDQSLRDALQKIIDMNVQYCIDRHGDAQQAESMACVRVAREALAGNSPLADRT